VGAALVTTKIKADIENSISAFLFAQRSWQTRQVERNLNHPD
jgi:hypothetical protein